MRFHIPGCREEPPDELSAKMVHLTYAGLHRGELTHASLLASARRWGEARNGLLEYTTGREIHPEPADSNRDEHFHCYFIFPRPREKEQRRAIKRRHICVKVSGPLQRLGRPLSAAEMQTRRSAGRTGPQGPPQRRR